MQRKHYTEEEKNAVMSQYAACGGEVKAMLAELGIPKSTFNQWLREYDLRYGCKSKYDFSPRNLTSDNAKEIIEYINSKDLSSSDKGKILSYLGYTVNGNNIRW